MLAEPKLGLDFLYIFMPPPKNVVWPKGIMCLSKFLTPALTLSKLSLLVRACVRACLRPKTSKSM